MKKIKLFSVSHEDPSYVTFIQKHPELDQYEDEKVLEAMVNEWIAEHPQCDVHEFLGPTTTATRIFLYIVYESKNN